MGGLGEGLIHITRPDVIIYDEPQVGEVKMLHCGSRTVSLQTTLLTLGIKTDPYAHEKTGTYDRYITII